MLNEECDSADDFKHDLEKEHEVTKSLEHKLKVLREKESASCATNVMHHGSSQANPRAGLASWPMGSALIEQIKPATTAPVVPGTSQWWPDGVDQEGWSDEEVTSTRPALLK